MAEPKPKEVMATSATSSPKMKPKVSVFERIRAKYKPDKPKPVKIKPPTADPNPVCCLGNLMSISTPSGLPPCLPKGYAGGKQPCLTVKVPWPTGQPTADEILEWANEIRDKGISDRNVFYTRDAIIYFARYFWDLSGPVFPQVKGIIQSAFE